MNFFEDNKKRKALKLKLDEEVREFSDIFGDCVSEGYHFHIWNNYDGYIAHQSSQTTCNFKASEMEYICNKEELQKFIEDVENSIWMRIRD